MFKIDHKKAQAASELAVFGAILIFILGTIIQTAVGNSYAQSESFKAMRMAMLASWEGAKASYTGNANTARNSASILFLEDRISPDYSKYGSMDRTPYMVNGSGTFTFELLYPIDPDEVVTMLPIMDVYINGQHFPFSTASYVSKRTISRPDSCPYSSGQQCLLNQCLRNQREWVGAGSTKAFGGVGAGNAGGTVNENEFAGIVPVNISATDCQSGAQQSGNSCCQLATSSAVNSCLIFNELVNDGELQSPVWSATPPTATVSQSTTSTEFTSWFNAEFPGVDQLSEISQVNSLLSANKAQYKLFYSQAVNGTPQFVQDPPTCATHPCKDKELSADLVLAGHSNSGGDLMFDLQRLGVYNANVNPSFVPPGTMRPNMVWEWMATAGTTPQMIGLDPGNNQYPQYDIDGRLKTVTIYGISQDLTTGAPIVSYEDFQGGDIDSTWDTSSCTPKPGLQNDAQIFTFTKAGTYLLIREGKLYNPDTNTYVRSVNQRDTIDLIQREIQLSNNTGRFCSLNCPAGVSYQVNSQCANGTTCTPNSTCADGSKCRSVASCSDGSAYATPTVQSCVASNCTLNPDPNPVEECVDGISDNCFTSANIAKTCLDTTNNMLYVRSRVEDRRGHFWITNTDGQLKVQ